MFINRYTAAPAHRALAREMLFLSRRSYLFVKNGFQHKTILFYPDYPFRKAEICKILSMTDYNITNNPEQGFDAVFFWRDATVRQPDQFLKTLRRKFPVINYDCTDISKERVDQVFSEVFGYSSLLEPRQYVGQCVRKSNQNGLHDGKIITCPVGQPEEGYIYQLLIDNLTPDGLALDYRVPVFGDTIPFLLLRYKSLTNRFDHTVRAVLADPADIFSPAERKQILAFCRKIGLEYGELDILRHRPDGRIFIVDANNTPSSPPAGVPLDKAERQFILEKSVEAFITQFVPVPAEPLN
jgi:hypothetical protein